MKLKIEKGTIQETLLLPLWGRAYESNKNNPRILDKKAKEILRDIDYDFSEITKTQDISQHGFVARAMFIDKMINNFIDRHPNGTIVNIGCGLDTTFDRIDNGKIKFYELDLPDVISIRKNFIQDTDRHISISSSFLETDYFNQIKVTDNVLFVSGGVFMYFTEDIMKSFFKKIADYFKNCDLYFDILSPLGMKTARRKIIKKSNMKMQLEGWSVKNAKNIEQWDSRFKILSETPLYSNVKSEVSFGHKLMLYLSDAMNTCGMVHLNIKS